MSIQGSLPNSPPYFSYSYYSVSVFSKVGVDGFIGSLVLFVCMFTAQIIGLLAIDKVSIFTSLIFKIDIVFYFSVVGSHFSSLALWG